MGTTPLEGLTYPASTANTDLWTHFQNLAEDVEDRLVLRAGRGLMATPASTSTDGTATSSTTDTRDAVLGNYTFTALASRRYRVMCTGTLNGSVANDRFLLNVRDGGASTPTGGVSTIVATGSMLTFVIASNGRQNFVLTNTFTPSAGTRTLALFVARFNGTGIGTPTGTRELYVEDIGPA